MLCATVCFFCFCGICQHVPGSCLTSHPLAHPQPPTQTLQTRSRFISKQQMKEMELLGGRAALTALTRLPLAPPPTPVAAGVGSSRQARPPNSSNGNGKVKA